MASRSTPEKPVQAYVGVEKLFQKRYGRPASAFRIIFSHGGFSVPARGGRHTPRQLPGTSIVVFEDSFDSAMEEAEETAFDIAPGLFIKGSELDEDQRAWYEASGQVPELSEVGSHTQLGPDGPYFIEPQNWYVDEDHLNTKQGKLEAKKALIALRTGSPAQYAEYVEDNDGHDPLRDKTYG